MRRYLLGIIAAVIAVGAVAFTSPEKEGPSSNLYFRYNGGDRFSIGSYTQLEGADEYAELGCGSGTQMCGIVTNTPNPVLQNDGNGYPAVNSTVLQSSRKP